MRQCRHGSRVQLSIWLVAGDHQDVVNAGTTMRVDLEDTFDRNRNRVRGGSELIPDGTLAMVIDGDRAPERDPRITEPIGLRGPQSHTACPGLLPSTGRPRSDRLARSQATTNRPPRRAELRGAADLGP